MPDPLLTAGRVALITGGSSGIGEAYARELGARGLQLILTGRDEARLRSVAEETAARYKVRVETVAVDLMAPDGPERVKAASDSLGMSPDVLVNNAGMGFLGTFDQVPLERHLEGVRLNNEAVAILTRLFLPPMLERGAGGIIFTSSMAGVHPLPHYAIYGATKAFVNSFSQALWAELRDQGIRVTVACPGPVGDTRFGERAGEITLRWFRTAAKREQPREEVVAEALDAFERDVPRIVTGSANRSLARFSDWSPSRLSLRITERMFRPSPDPSSVNGAAPGPRPIPPPPRVMLPPTGKVGPGTCAIVTGASWGIGETFAEILAARGADLLLVARTETRLLTLAADLAARHNVRVEIAALDLAEQDGPRKLCEAAAALNFRPTLLVNNAGVGGIGRFAEMSTERIREMVRLNETALTDLTYRVLEGMLAQGSGSIINVGSASGFQPLPGYALYAATKTFVLSLSTALWAENRGRGVRVLVVCPGAVDDGDTPDPAAAAAPPFVKLPRKVTRQEVVNAALKGLERDDILVRLGGASPMARLVLKVLPRRTRLRLTGALLQRYPTMLTGMRRRDP